MFIYMSKIVMNKLIMIKWVAILKSPGGLVKLATKTLYAPRILLDIARHHDKGPVPSGHTSHRQGISAKYLDQIIRPLKKGRILASVRGPKGGQVLLKKPEEITLGQILRLMEGEILPQDRTRISDPQASQDENRLHRIWMEAIQVFYRRLDAVSLADLLGSADSLQCGLEPEPSCVEARCDVGTGKTGLKTD